MSTNFAIPVNNVSSAVGSSGYTAGSGSLVLATGGGSAFPALTGSHFYRVTVIQRANAYLPVSPSFTYTVYKATGVSGDTLTGLSVIDGTTDRDYSAGDVVEVRVAAGSLSDIHTAINALEVPEATTVYETVSNNNPSWITSLPGSVISGNITGDAASITGSITESQVTGLAADLRARALDPTVVHLAGTETITGAKIFSTSPTVPTPATSDSSTKAASTANVKGQGYIYDDAYVSVDDPAYGAVGDGVTNDTNAIQAALNSGKHVRFGPGKTYLMSGTLTVPVGITVELCGATVMQMPQVTTTLLATTDTTTGTPTLNVASTAGLVAGMYVSAITGATGTGLLGGGLFQVLPTNYGSGYTSNPTVTVTPHVLDIGAVAPTVTANYDLQTGKVMTYTITNAGSGMIRQPTFAITGGGGSNAAAMASISATQDGNVHQIIAVVDSTHIKVHSAFSYVFPIGSTIYTCGTVFKLSGSNRLIGPGKIDGNSANFTIGRWETMEAIFIIQNLGVGITGTAKLSTVNGIEVANFPSDGILVEGNWPSVTDCYIHDIWGNGIHFSGSPGTGSVGGHAVVERVHVCNCNVNGAVGHVNGGIIWSDTIQDASIIGCIVDTTPIYGIGSIDSTGNSDCTLAANTLRNCLLGGVGINMTSLSSAPARITVTGNRFYKCGGNKNTYIIKCYINGNGSDAYPNQIAITGNVIDCYNSNSSGIAVQYCNYVSVTGNTLYGNAQNTNSMILNGARNLAISGNTIYGFSNGMYVMGCYNPAIVGNSFLFQISYAITDGGGNIGCCISSNTIQGQAASWRAIVTNTATTVVGNTIYCGTGASYGISVTGNNNNVQGNMIRSNGSGSPTTGILVTALTMNNVITNNSITSNATTTINLNGTTVNNTAAGSGNFTTA